MTVDEFVRRFPYLYHMANAGSWDGIRRHGLLSTSAILDLFGYHGERRKVIEGRHRPESIVLYHPRLGSATIRDQKPLNEGKLAECLTGGMQPHEWYEMLNQKVFFWASYERLVRLLGARAYRDRDHDVLTVESYRIVKKYLDKVELSHINTGSTLMNAPLRGRGTFCSIEKFPVRSGGRRRDVVEVAVKEGIRDIEDFVVRVERMQRGVTLATLWERP